MTTTHPLEHATTIDPIALHRRLGRKTWAPPIPFGPDGCLIDSRDHKTRIIVTAADHDNTEWIHASISHPGHIPTYGELARLHQAVWGAGWAYQVFAPPADHVNIHASALHLWGRLDGTAALPNFGVHGTI